MKIAIVGAGYVGLTTATCLAALGHQVTCHDANPERLAELLSDSLPIYEPGLETAFVRATQTGALRIVRTLQECVAESSAIFLAVGTPALPDGSVDLSQLTESAHQIAQCMPAGVLVVVKSTVSVGTCRALRRIIARRRGSIDFAVGSNPEFLREGSAISDFLCPDRIVIGADDEEALEILREIYRPLIDSGIPVLGTSTENAEMVKHTANAFLALKIGFINEVADFCDKAGADISAVAEGIGLDRRIGNAFLTPGPGFGGSCFPKDTRAFAATGRGVGAPQALIETLIIRNEARQHELAEKISHEARRRDVSAIAVLGLAFKAETDDVRESPAVVIASSLLDKGFRIRAHDPRAMPNASRVLQGIDWCETPCEAAKGTGAVAVLTEWPDFARLDLPELRRRMRGNLLFDFRNIIDRQAAEVSDLLYFGVGRGRTQMEVASIAAMEGLAPSSGHGASLRGARIR